MNNKRYELALTFALCLSMAYASCAFALPSSQDYFGRKTAGTQAAALKSTIMTTSQQPLPLNTVDGNQDVATQWFEKVDDIIISHRPSLADRVILTRPFEQEQERVKEWSAVAAKVAKNYREMARQLRTSPVPANLTGVKEYRDLLADWYGDAASVYEDLIRPCKPAHTIEELNASLDQIKNRAQSLGQSNANLISMESNLRQMYHVHAPKYDDAIGNFVNGK
jgi:hypothetical protein